MQFRRNLPLLKGKPSRALSKNLGIRRQLLPFVIAFAICILAIVELLFFFDPREKIEIYSFFIDPLLIMYFFIFLAGYLLFTYIFLNSIIGFFLSVFIVFTLVLRMLGFTSSTYMGILFIIVILCILYFRRTPKTHNPVKKEH